MLWNFELMFPVSFCTLYLHFFYENRFFTFYSNIDISRAVMLSFHTIVGRDEDSVWPKNGSGALHFKPRQIFKDLLVEYLDNFKNFLFCFHTFGGRRPLLALEPRIRSEFERMRILAGFLNLAHIWYLRLTLKV